MGVDGTLYYLHHARGSPHLPAEFMEGSPQSVNSGTFTPVEVRIVRTSTGVLHFKMYLNSFFFNLLRLCYDGNMMRWLKSVQRLWLILLAGLLIATFGLVAWIFSVYLYVPSPLDSLQLSNGKTIKLGQSEKSLKDELANELLAAKNNSYVYTFKLSKARRSEVLIIVDKKKVVVIKAGQEPDRQGQDPSNIGYVSRDRQNKSNVGTGLAISNLQLALSGRTILIDRNLSGGRRARGYVLHNTKWTTSYYFVNPCSTGDKLILIVIAFSNYEKTAIGDGAGCSTHG